MPPSSTSTPTGSPLMDLPAEMREMICQLSLRSLSLRSRGAIDTLNPEAINTGALLQVCSQLRWENIDYFYSQNKFRLQVNRTTFPIALKWLTARDTTYLQQIPQLIVKFYTDDAIQQWKEEVKAAESVGDLDRVNYVKSHDGLGGREYYGGRIVIPWGTDFNTRVGLDFALALVATGVDPRRVKVDSMRKTEEAPFATHMPKIFRTGMERGLRRSGAR
ncbi:hypothetical protein LTR56_010965 [Elasticomyces elasticus]|nr:hypothetical protein LTR56_010965 [Elasticomyces elasticus]KAK3662663.1 hypothetical protein LTR22_006513 [Elasticomyces elasticus]KAK4926553.1 hypothetical protein LTR49_006487 [Elasticomyces elasticus]KAK5760646.1 hypothetical protein LTS12_009183 [Elasticomyces elasticus]